jgi:hypothetical protein
MSEWTDGFLWGIGTVLLVEGLGIAWTMWVIR